MEAMDYYPIRMIINCISANSRDPQERCTPKLVLFQNIAVQKHVWYLLLSMHVFHFLQYSRRYFRQEGNLGSIRNWCRWNVSDSTFQLYNFLPESFNATNGGPEIIYHIPNVVL